MPTSNIKLPTSNPSCYSTLKGLLSAVERVLKLRPDRVAGLSRGMWLHNAEFWARTRFHDSSSVQKLRDEFAITRPQDLKGGNSLFGVALPTRVYTVGDTVPSVGKIVEKCDTPHGLQFLIRGTWYLASSLEAA